MRKKLIAGNWKMNNGATAALTLANALKAAVSNPVCDIAICTPYICLQQVCEAVKGSPIAVGAQNMHFEDKGAYTGEISADMLLEIGVKYVIIGHSERRQYFAETNETVNLKTIKAIAKGLIPIVCVGESLPEREKGITFDLIRQQIKIAYLNISADNAKKTVIAYEPIWAIGTGVTASDEQAEEVIADIRNTVASIYGADVATTIQILYGGSMNAANAAGLMKMPNIDGGLVGGASLKAEDFVTIIKSA